MLFRTPALAEYAILQAPVVQVEDENFLLLEPVKPTTNVTSITIQTDRPFPLYVTRARSSVSSEYGPAAPSFSNSSLHLANMVGDATTPEQSAPLHPPLLPTWSHSTNGTYQRWRGTAQLRFSHLSPLSAVTMQKVGES